MGRPSKHGRLDFDLRKRSRCEPILAKKSAFFTMRFSEFWLPELDLNQRPAD